MSLDIYLKELSQELDKQSDDVDKQLCLSYAQKLINNNVPVIFDIKHFSLLLGVNQEDLLSILFTADEYLYSKAYIPKRSGGARKLSIPSVDLKYIQSWILNNILENIPISEFAMGFCSGRSIVQNARHHLSKECVINVDLNDFFPSIKMDDIFRIFFYYGYTKELSFCFSKLCCHNGSLPQGSPASPYLSNIICLKLDKRLSLLAKKYDASYSRYADDITISGNKMIKNIMDPLFNIIKDQGFSINTKKTRIQYSHQRQEVTGLIVNGIVEKIPKKYKKKFKQEIYFCQKYGPANHQSKINDKHAFYKEHLYGKAYFIQMVEPELGKKLLKELSQINWGY
jgi:Retron-type reverse transcriptase